jgi:Tfp pilus assembly protein PilN
MINLLPPKEREKVIWEKKLRLVFILGFLAIFCLLTLWLALSAIKIHINSQKEAQIILTEIEKNKSSQLQELRRRIQKINQTLTKINKFYDDQILTSELLERVSNLLPRDVYLETFVFDKSKGEVRFSGTVRTLESLNRLREKLQKEDGFEDIDFSIATYVPSENIDFKVKFIFKK